MSRTNVVLDGVAITNSGKGLYNIDGVSIKAHGEIPDVRIQNSVIADTYYRGISIIGSKKVTLKQNVLYNIAGVALTTSKADETDLYIEDNTIATVRSISYGENIDNEAPGIVINSP